jgi:membrane associated rhomboid family serine protease
MNIFDEIKYNFQQKDNGLIKIILVNVLVFVVLGIIHVITLLTGTGKIFDLIYQNFRLPSDLNVFLYRPWTLFTYFFAHDMSDLLHIVFNMLFLYWFGKVISDYISSRRLISLYILGGLAGGLTFLTVFNLLPYFAPQVADKVLVGSSGSVYAIVVAAATLVPHVRFNLLLFGPVKITYIAAFFVFGSWLSVAGHNAGGNLCHLGGALFGYIYIVQLRKGRDLGKPISAIQSFLKNLTSPRLKVSHRGTASASDSNEPTQEEIDRILDKINKTGYDSLSKQEKQKLFKASEK